MGQKEAKSFSSLALCQTSLARLVSSLDAIYSSALETLQKKLYAYNCASNSLYLDAVTVAPKNTAEGRGVALSILAGELQKLMTAPETLALVEELYARRQQCSGDC